MPHIPDPPTARRAGDRPRALVLYDGHCSLCRRSVARLRRLDWLDRFDYQDARAPAPLPVTDPPLDRARLLAEMHVLTPSRSRAYAGFRALRWIAVRIPVFWLVLPLLFLPGAPWLGRRLYRWVARNRFHLASCPDGQCAGPPGRMGNESGWRG